MHIKSATQSGTPETAALGQGWVTTPPLCSKGMLLGPSMQTRSPERFHPWELKRQRRIHSTIFEVIAQKDHGKSTLLKWLQAGLMKFQAGQKDGFPEQIRVRNNDRKLEQQEPEYGPITEYFGGEVVDLGSYGLINPFVFHSSVKMSQLDVVDMAVNIAESVANKPLTDHQTLAIQVGVWRMMTQGRGYASPEALEIALRTLDMSDVRAYFDASNENVLKMFEQYGEARTEEELGWLKLSMGHDPAGLVVNQAYDTSRRRELNFAEASFKHDAGIASTYFAQLLRGNYGRVFGGVNSLFDKLSAPMVDFDWTRVSPKAAAMLEAMFFKWQDIAMGDPKLESIIPHLDIGDEEHEAFNNIMHVRYYASYIAKARQLKTARFISTQFETDLLMAGDPGSEIRNLSQKIIRGIAGRFIGQMEADDETKHRLSELGISEYDIEFLTIIPMGCFGVKLQGEPIRFIQVIPPPTVLKLAETNAAARAMTESVHWQSLPEVVQRALETGLIKPDSELLTV